MPEVTVPATIEEATEAWNGIGALLTAKDWERAAIVYAYTEPTEKPGPKRSVTSDRSSFAGFAALCIAGLRSKNTVQLTTRT